MGHAQGAKERCGKGKLGGKAKVESSGPGRDGKPPSKGMCGCVTTSRPRLLAAAALLGLPVAAVLIIYGMDEQVGALQLPIF